MKRLMCVLLSFVLAFCCAAPAAAAETVYLYPVSGVPENGLHVFGHRGYSAAAPENTLAAFRLAGENGFWGVECDAIRSADGAIVFNPTLRDVYMTVDDRPVLIRSGETVRLD